MFVQEVCDLFYIKKLYTKYVPPKIKEMISVAYSSFFLFTTTHPIFEYKSQQLLFGLRDILIKPSYVGFGLSEYRPVI